jgi:CubicO group peptidase (beta-lactamase class C family)
VASDNWLRSALAREAEASPGERFIYSTGNTHLLGAAIAEAADLPLPEYADRVLFGPLGVTATWDHDPQGHAFAGNNLGMSTRGLLRFGQLMAEGGVWQGRQLVPRRWIEASTRRHSEGLPDRYGAYGYLWWLPEGEPKLWLAAGFGSQLLVVAPESRVVVAVTATLEPKDAAWERRVLEEVRELARSARRDPDS